MNTKNVKNIYDDGNIPEIDLPQDTGVTHAQDKESDSQYCMNRVVTPVEPLPESSRPRKDGPGGD